MGVPEDLMLDGVAAAKSVIPLKNREHAARVISEGIKGLRARGMTQAEIGKLFGLAQGTISELEGRRVSKLGLRVLLCARQALNISIDEILGLPPIKEDDESDPPMSGELSA